MFSRYLPVRAFSMAAGLISEAKIWTGKDGAGFVQIFRIARWQSRMPLLRWRTPAPRRGWVVVGRAALENAREDELLQALKRFPIAEKTGHADQQIPLQRAQLVGIVLQPLAILRQGCRYCAGPAAAGCGA